MLYKERAIANAVVLAFGNVAELVLAYFFIAYLSRGVGAAGLGQYYYILNLVNTVALLYIFSPAALLSKKIAQNEPTLLEDMGIYYAVGSLISVVCILVILILAICSSRYWDFKIALTISSVCIISIVFGNLIDAIAKANLNVWPSVLSRVAERLFSLFLLFLFLGYGKLTIISAIFIVSLASLVQFGILTLLSRHYLKCSFKFPWSRVVLLLRESVPFFFGGAFALIYYRTDVVMLGWLASDENVGYYGAGNQVYQICMIVVAIINAVVFPPLMALYRKGAIEFTTAVADLFKYVIVLIVGMGFGLYALSDKIIPLVFGNELLPSVWVLKAFSIILFFSMFVSLFSTIFTALNKQQIFANILGGTALLNVIGNYYFIPRYTYFATVYMTAISVFLCCVLSVYFSKKYLRYHLPVMAILKSFLAGAVMWHVLRYYHGQSLFLLPFLGLTVYSLMVIVLRYFSGEDYQFFKIFVLKRVSQDSATKREIAS
ncbi:MAG: flippase [Candidatus Omnitrophica bacterium]|nr:flippase [Candidatus Omnitrophota bacterium]